MASRPRRNFETGRYGTLNEGRSEGSSRNGGLEFGGLFLNRSMGLDEQQVFPCLAHGFFKGVSYLVKISDPFAGREKRDPPTGVVRLAVSFLLLIFSPLGRLSF